MNSKQKKAVKKFQMAVKELREQNVIRSDKYLGDIAETIVSEKYNIALAKSGRNPGHDGTITKNGKKKKIQIKYHGSMKGTNLNIGNPKKYDRLFVVLGKDSCLKENNNNHDFEIYVFYSKKLLNRTYIAKKDFIKKTKEILNLED